MPKLVKPKTQQNKRGQKIKLKQTQPETLAISIVPQPYEQLAPVKKRGRPRKIRPVLNEDQVQIVESSLVSVSSSIVPGEGAKIVRRGRPKKTEPTPPVVTLPEPVPPQTDTKVSVDWLNNVPGPTPIPTGTVAHTPPAQPVNAAVDQFSYDLFAEDVFLENLLAPVAPKAPVPTTADTQAPPTPLVDSTDAPTAEAEDATALTTYANVVNQYVANEEVPLPQTGLTLSEQDSGLLHRLVAKVDALVMNAIRNNDARRRMALLQSSSMQSKRRIEELLHRQTELVQAMISRQLQLAEAARQREHQQVQERLAYEREQAAMRLEQARREATARLEYEREQAEAKLAHERKQAELLREQEIRHAQEIKAHDLALAREKIAAQEAANARLQKEVDLYRSFALSDKQFLSAPFMHHTKAAEHKSAKRVALSQPTSSINSPAEDDTNSILVTDPVAAINTLKQNYQPRGRGRPRKQPQTTEAANPSPVAQPKKKRGRPPGNTKSTKAVTLQDVWSVPKTKKSSA